MMKKSLLIAAVAVLGAGPAFAGEPIDVVADADVTTAKITFADLNITNDQGMDRLKDRIKRAARKICNYEGHKPLTSFQTHRRCFDDARADGDRQVETLRRDILRGTVSVTNSVITIRRR